MTRIVLKRRFSRVCLWVAWTVVLSQISATAQPRDPWRSSPYFAGFHIVMPEEASPLLRESAEMFKTLWEMSTRRPVAISPINEGDTNVWLREQRNVEDLLPLEINQALSEDGFIIHTHVPRMRFAAQGAEKQLVIAGGSEQAVVDGVYAFFFKVMGMRWLAPDTVFVPPPRTAIEEQTLILRTEFRFRQIGLLEHWPAGHDEYRRAHHLALAATVSPGDAAYFDVLLEEYPEDDRIPVDYGAAQGVQTVLKEIAELIQAADNPEGMREKGHGAPWRIAGATVWRLAAMDWLRPRLAPEGRALVEREHTTAAAVLSLANDLARELENSFPDEVHLVHVLLSPRTQAPTEQLRPHPNVIVQLSTAACNFAVPLADRRCPLNTRFAADLAGWRALGTRLYVLDHLVNARDPRLPFPQRHAIQGRILFYAQQGVEGVYFAGADSAAPGSVHSAVLRIYLAARLMADPDVILEDEIEEFLTAYYGRAAKPVKECLELLEGALRASGMSLTLDDEVAWLNDDTVEAALLLLREALSATLPEETRTRVEQFQDTFLHVAQTRERTRDAETDNNAMAEP